MSRGFGASREDVLRDMLDEAREDWQNVLDGLQSIDRHETVFASAHGAIDAVRANHTGLRPVSWETTSPTPSAAPDPFTGQFATIKRGRNKKGTTSKVTHVGRAFVAGAEPNGVRDVTGRIASVRLDAVTLSAMADEFFRAEGVDMAEEGLVLVGAVQGRSWEQITRAEGSREALTLAQHRTDIGGGFIDPRRVLIGSSARSDHKYRETHSHALGWTMADALDMRVGAPVRDVRRFAISRIRKDGAPMIPPAPRARRDDLDAVVEDVSGIDGKVRSVTRLTGRTPSGEFVTYGDRVVVRRTIIDASRPTRTRVVVGTAPTERVAVGHVWRDRPGKATPHAKRDAAARERIARADAVRANVETSPIGRLIESAWFGAASGERVTLALPDGGTLAFTRHDGRPVKYRWTRGDEYSAWTSRTPHAAAIRLSTRVS